MAILPVVVLVFDALLDIVVVVVVVVSSALSLVGDLAANASRSAQRTCL